VSEFFARNAETMKTNKLSTIAVAAALLLALVLSIASALPLRAETPPVSQTLNLDRGQARLIDHLMKGTKPAIRVIDNPLALIIHDEVPGQVLLLGADRGQWEVTVTRDDGTRVAYQVHVAAIVSGSTSLDPGTGPLTAAAAKATKSDAPAPTASRYAVEAYSSDDAPQPNEHSAQTLAAPLPMIQQDSEKVASAYRNDPHADSDESQTSSMGHNYLPPEVVSLMAGASQIIDFPRRMKRISIADSTVADIQVTSPYQLNLIGHKPGFTTLAVWDDKGHYVERAVRVDNGGAQQVMLNAIVAELDLTKIETQGIDLSAALTRAGISLTSLPGQVATPYAATSQLSSGTLPGIVPPGGQLAPLLLSSALTYGVSTSTGNFATQNFFQFLESHSLGRILAQPHLLANSGQSASFLSGGEIPIVLAQALNTSIVFKDFGTKINCRPTVIGRNDIELLVKSEVSEPDYAHGVALFGFTVPAFVTRRADTLVRLKDGQTLIIAGLILRNRNAVVSKVPYLGDLPYAGALFRNTNWEDQQTDLVMSVRPEIVNPLPAGGQVFMPSERGPLTPDEIRTQKLDTPDAARPRF
jgi:Flp pilus assembly secretin CpaC